MLEYPSFGYLYQFYRYVLAKRKMEFAIFFSITFIFSLFPFLILWWEVHGLGDKEQRGFFGDGSILTLCSGILCSYFAILFDYKNEKEKHLNTIVNIGLVILYFTLSYVFIKCQLNFDRNWCFITNIVMLSGFVLLLTIFCAMYLTFKEKVEFADVQKYSEEVKAKKIEKELLKKTKSKKGVSV
jgi:hypothetical protein